MTKKINNWGEEVQPLSLAQEEYFKDSKIRDEEGNLKVCYHHTDHIFDAFDKKFITDDSYCGSGFYFTGMQDFGGCFGQNTLECYINIENPLIVEELERWQKEDLLDYISRSEDYQNGYLTRISGYPPESEDYDISSLIDLIEYGSYSEETNKIIEELINSNYYDYFTSSKNIEDLIDYIDEWDDLKNQDDFKESLTYKGLDKYLDFECLQIYDLTSDKFHYGYWNEFAELITEWAKNNRYDGILSERCDSGRIREIVVFKPNQIKLTTNLYPTYEANFRDNSEDYFRKHPQTLEDVINKANDRVEDRNNIEITERKLMK